MISNILGFLMIAAAISTLVFTIITILRFTKRREAGWTKYALLASIVAGIAFFIALGSTYGPPAESGQQAIKRDDVGTETAKTNDDEAPPRNEEGQASEQREGTPQPLALPPSTQRPDTEKSELTGTSRAKPNAEPDFDAMLDELEQHYCSRFSSREGKV